MASTIDFLLERDLTGTFNFSVEKPVTKYEWALMIADTFGHSRDLVRRSYGETQTLAKRPYDTRMDITDLITRGIKPISVEEGLKIMKEQMS